MRCNTAFAIFVVSLSMSFCLLAHAGEPYIDRFPSGRGTAISVGGQLSATGCNGDCPTSSIAKLVLWVPDDATVLINGQLTKHQALAGVHRFSRIYSLHGLGAGGAVECVVQVDRFDMDGNPFRMQREFKVNSGESYDIRFPQGFIEVMIPQTSIHEGGLHAPTGIDQHPSNDANGKGEDPANGKPSLDPQPEHVYPQPNTGTLPNNKNFVPDPSLPPSVEREIGARKVPLDE